MSKANKGSLGRGLDSLIASSNANPHSDDQLRHIPVSAIKQGRYQARVQIDDAALAELAESVKAQGIIQPVIVREYGLDGYELIAGERRWRAAQLAGLSEIPAVVKHASDKAVMAMGLIENIQRENLNPIEEAQGLRRLIDEFELTHEYVAEAVGRSRSAISNSLRLLKLPEPVQEMLFNKHLEMGHARSLINLPVNAQLELANKAVKNGWSVREMERRSQQVQQGKTPTASQQIDPDVVRLTDAITESLGVATEIKTRDRKKGKIVLHFDSADTFDALMKRLGIELPDA
ncbi:ParB/RepB/Spo0J family partition protein [Kingella kingae]|uniref:ParB/RepB/Spo0J family partition protein n=1 Tax=Kingella kingae TaxID=504 RepID=UPI000406DB9B|nr:ParB/RepB/Spo0J family partition protein [Kingella kingae]MDK4575791.1 ParB/RepB/Spo0J family partition protein [Kingella kingae]MDK4581850.1 ParB/RepB/Spo0J family partition protein [Kingella kingae]MDK4592270.1 ParB/RepB/Spo0J family partition protein [Kingella kingae]MDK4594460.1 ParB/RepB/Spo0J family partition protein [Kingella kingae]MDK4643954.1 ParB/RepB/Spo0J family partition protein [Kingella kingae]